MTFSAQISVTTRLIVLAGSVAILAPGLARAEPGSSDVQALREEVRLLREENARSRQRIDQLEQKLESVQVQQQDSSKDLETKIQKQAAAAATRWDTYFGDNRFIVTGWGSGNFDWVRHPDDNTFGATFDPVFLFRATDKVLFESESEFELDSDGGTGINLEYAQADVFLNDYATLVAGKFLLPFGEFIQELHPGWINKLVSKPLPYLEGEEGGLLPFSDVGAQVRGGLQLFHTEGVDLDYTLFVSNGPRFESDEDGAPLVSNNIDLNRGKGFGARFAIYPLPLTKEIGRLKIGASTYDGTWDDGNNLWFTSWGVDFAYQLDQLELRGEYLQTRRELLGQSADRRDGWYLQAAYKLARLPVAPLNKMELVARYSGLKQGTLEVDPLTGEGETRLGDPGQMALGVDYWITPSVVGKLEYDFDWAQHGRDNRAFRAQLAVGF